MIEVLALIIGWWITVDGAVSIAFRLGELDDANITLRQKVEFITRFLRGMLGLTLIVAACVAT